MAKSKNISQGLIPAYRTGRRPWRKKQDIWFAIEKIPDGNYIMTYAIFTDYGKRLKQQDLGSCLKQIFWIVNDGIFDLCYVRSEFDKMVKKIFAKAINDLIWLAKINEEVEIFAREYLVFAKSLLKLNLAELSNK